MSTGYGAKLFGMLGLRGAAKGLRQARQIGKEAEAAEAAAVKADKTIKLALEDRLTMGLNVLSVMQLTRFAIQDITEIGAGEGGFSDILSLATSSVILAYRLRALYLEIIGLQATSNALAFASPMAIVGGLLGLSIVAGVADIASRQAKKASKRKDDLLTNERMRALLWGATTG